MKTYTATVLGKRQLFRRTVQAVSAQRLLSPLGYRQYLHGQVMRHPDGGYVVEPIGDGDQAMLARMARANCLIVVDEDGHAIGAVGITGDTSDNDEACTLAGIAAAGLRAQG